jgi:hypothetical protein
MSIVKSIQETISKLVSRTKIKPAPKAQVPISDTEHIDDPNSNSYKKRFTSLSESLDNILFQSTKNYEWSPVAIACNNCYKLLENAKKELVSPNGLVHVFQEDIERMLLDYYQNKIRLIAREYKYNNDELLLKGRTWKNQNLQDRTDELKMFLDSVLSYAETINWSSEERKSAFRYCIGNYLKKIKN